MFLHVLFMFLHVLFMFLAPKKKKKKHMLNMCYNHVFYTCLYIFIVLLYLAPYARFA